MDAVQDWQEYYVQADQQAVLNKLGVTWLKENGYPEAKPLCVRRLRVGGHKVG